MHYYLDKFNQTGVFKCFKQGMQNSVAIEDCREGSLPNNQPLLLITVSVIIPRPLFWKGIRCCARLACLEVIIVPLRLMQLDEIGRDIHYQRLNNVFRHKSVPMICPSTASQQGAKTLCIHTTWMWDAVNRGLQPQPWSYNIIRQWGFSASTMTPQHHTGSAIPLFPWNSPPPAHVMVRHKGAPICPSTASQGAKTLCIHPIWMWDAVNGGLKPQPWHRDIIQARPYPISPKNPPHLHM